jgi:hypothetical protein
MLKRITRHVFQASPHVFCTPDSTKGHPQFIPSGFSLLHEKSPPTRNVSVKLSNVLLQRSEAFDYRSDAGEANEETRGGFSQFIAMVAPDGSRLRFYDATPLIVQNVNKMQKRG